MALMLVLMAITPGLHYGGRDHKDDANPEAIFAPRSKHSNTSGGVQADPVIINRIT